MSARTYLSIGDVLTLLREEFPDVTISKIRFLESQGLVNPERSPSGYRKFFEHDVERLRWVLRQQREHFLPLKVIRDRLAEGNLEEGPETAAHAATPETTTPAATTVSNGRVAEPAHAGVGAAAAPRHAATATGSGAGVSGGLSSVPDDEPMTKADSDAMARILADASRRTAQLPESTRAALRVVGDEPAAAPAATASAAPRHAAPLAPVSTSTSARPNAAAATASTPASAAATLRANRGPEGGAGPTAAAKGAADEARAATPAAKPAPETAASGAGRRNADAPAPAAKAPSETKMHASAKPAASTTSMVTGASLTAGELCSASGLSEIELANLEGFGLVESVVVAGILTYDEDALTVANLAAELRVFGIEPRHLRLYKNAVDREVGLIEQVIIPLLRQRNPESRQRAIDSAEQLGSLGQTMRSTLLRSALRRHLGG